MTHLKKIIIAGVLIGGMSSVANAGYTIDRYITCNDGYKMGWASQYPNSQATAIDECKKSHQGYSGNNPFDHRPELVRPKGVTLIPNLPHTPSDPGPGPGPSGPRPKGNTSGSANPN